MNRIVIIFPGLGYTADKPLLYYGLSVACSCGYQEHRKLSFVPSKRGNIRGDEAAMKAAFDELYQQAKVQLEDIDWSQYDDIVFISKSIGTIIASAYANDNQLLDVKHVLYTPLKYTFQYRHKKAIAFIGSQDAWGDYQEVVRLSENENVPIKVYDNCNHSLEIKDDIAGNILRLNDIMSITTEFLMHAQLLI